MKRFMSLRVVASLLVLFTMGVLSPQTASAQQEVVCNPPVDFHRFIVNWSTFGTFLTDNFNEGLNRGFAPYAFPGPMKIAIPPGPGYTPVPGQGLQPLYRFRIVQGSRTYFGYFNGFASGPGYFFERGGRIHPARVRAVRRCAAACLVQPVQRLFLYAGLLRDALQPASLHLWLHGSLLPRLHAGRRHLLLESPASAMQQP